jgi:hypothetical protein
MASAMAATDVTACQKSFPSQESFPHHPLLLLPPILPQAAPAARYSPTTSKRKRKFTKFLIAMQARKKEKTRFPGPKFLSWSQMISLRRSSTHHSSKNTLLSIVLSWSRIFHLLRSLAVFRLHERRQLHQQWLQVGLRRQGG